jgi:hypothetical protein
MHQQIKHGDSLATPFTISTFSTTENEQISKVITPKKPLDFLLPFTIAANMSAGLMLRENLWIITEELRKQYSLGKADYNFYLLDFLMTEARLPFASDPVKPWEYQGWLLLYIILANAVHPKISNRWGWWARCHLNDGSH